MFQMMIIILLMEKTMLHLGLLNMMRKKRSCQVKLLY